MSASTGMRRWKLAIVVAAVGVTCVFLCGARVSQAVFTLHIESQPLDVALQELAKQTGLQVLFFSELTEGRRSVALNGKYTLDAALTALLSDAKLTYRRINARTIEIVPARSGRAIKAGSG